MRAPTLVLAALVLVAGCGSDEPASAGPTTTHTGWLRDRAPGAIVLDPALLLSGREAIEAARLDGQLPPDGTLPNDFYVDDDDAATVTYEVARDVAVSVYDCSEGCRLQRVDATDFLTGNVEPYGGAHAFVSVVVRGDEVVRISEIYLP